MSCFFCFFTFEGLIRFKSELHWKYHKKTHTNCLQIQKFLWTFFLPMYLNSNNIDINMHYKWYAKNISIYLHVNMCYIPRIAKALIVIFLLFFITGRRCERIDSCLSNPCGNGGTCSAPSGGSFLCSCPPGYTGLRCLNDTNECATTPSICQNEGVCFNTPGSYKWAFCLNKEISNIWYIYEIYDMMFTVKTEGNKMHETDWLP